MLHKICFMNVLEWNCK